MKWPYVTTVRENIQTSRSNFFVVTVRPFLSTLLE